MSVSNSSKRQSSRSTWRKWRVPARRCAGDRGASERLLAGDVVLRGPPFGDRARAPRRGAGRAGPRACRRASRAQGPRRDEPGERLEATRVFEHVEDAEVLARRLRFDRDLEALEANHADPRRRVECGSPSAELLDHQAPFAGRQGLCERPVTRRELEALAMVSTPTPRARTSGRSALAIANRRAPRAPPPGLKPGARSASTSAWLSSSSPGRTRCSSTSTSPLPTYVLELAVVVVRVLLEERQDLVPELRSERSARRRVARSSSRNECPICFSRPRRGDAVVELRSGTPRDRARRPSPPSRTRCPA